ncbi:unnamed protein product, partial [Allacma fusca]
TSWTYVQDLEDLASTFYIEEE